MRVEKLDREGNVLKRFNSIEAAAADAKVSVETVQRQLRGYGYGEYGRRVKPKTQCGFTWRYYKDGKEEKPAEKVSKGIGNKNRSKPIYMVDENNRILKEYESARECARESGYSINQVFGYVSGRTDKEWFKDRYGVGFVYVADYKKENSLIEDIENNMDDKKEIIKPVAKDYYINVLVGLVNRTLIDGARYNINGLEFKYNKDEDILINEAGTKIIRDYYIKMVEIEKPLLNEKERQFISNIIRAFDEIKGIEKCHDIFNGFEFLRIVASSPAENLDLPKFREGEYYGGLELNRIYTLEELDIK